jgi:hypothetical protein
MNTMSVQCFSSRPATQKTRQYLASAPDRLMFSRINSSRSSFLVDCPRESVLSHFTQNCGGNCIENGILRAAVSSESGASRPLKTMSDPKGSKLCESKSPLYSKATDSEWAEYDFDNRRIASSHCPVRSPCHRGPGCGGPKNWVIDVPMKGEIGKQPTRGRMMDS